MSGACPGLSPPRQAAVRPSRCRRRQDGAAGPAYWARFNPVRHPLSAVFMRVTFAKRSTLRRAATPVRSRHRSPRPRPGCLSRPSGTWAPPRPWSVHVAQVALFGGELLNVGRRLGLVQAAVDDGDVPQGLVDVPGHPGGIAAYVEVGAVLEPGP